VTGIGAAAVKSARSATEMGGEVGKRGNGGIATVSCDSVVTVS
jgi:hypothetical protein